MHQTICVYFSVPIAYAKSQVSVCAGHQNHFICFSTAPRLSSISSDCLNQFQFINFYNQLILSILWRILRPRTGQEKGSSANGPAVPLGRNKKDTRRRKFDCQQQLKKKREQPTCQRNMSIKSTNVVAGLLVSSWPGSLSLPPTSCFLPSICPACK